MKIAITGHKKGIGHEFAKQLAQHGHDIVGISRSDGENIRRVAHTASLIEPCDMFINNAISFYAQTELLFEVWHRWNLSEHHHHIWNISTKLCEKDTDTHVHGLTMRESMQYRNQKMALELAHKQLTEQHSKIEMTLIRPGSVNTQTFSAEDAMPPEDYVASVIEQHGDFHGR